jgi:hypothetical protein
MYLDPDVAPPLAGFRLYASVSLLVLSVPSDTFLKLLSVFDLFITPGTMFQAYTNLFEKKFILVSILIA